LLRGWQATAINSYRETLPVDWLVTATPGSGKTRLALVAAAHLLTTGRIQRVVVVTPTDHLRRQWADAAALVDIHLDPTLSNQSGHPAAHFHGYTTTYAQVAARAYKHRLRVEGKKTLVILDELHHAGDGLSWGDAVGEAFEPATRRIALTGTPFRTGAEPIPFVRYASNDAGEQESVADVEYSYADSLTDGVCRPVVFAAYTGVSRWRSSATDALDEVTAQALDADASKAVADRAWRVALHPEGDWIRHVIAAADARLSDLRAAGTSDAAGLLLATDQDAARAYAEVLQQVTGHVARVAVSDDPDSADIIEGFAKSTQRWLISVRQVSEGVDIPRAMVLVYATTYRTPLFWAQAVGRVVRARNRRETATVFVPAVRPLLTLAADMETQRRHVLPTPPVASDDFDLPDLVERDELGDNELQFLSADAQFGHVLAAGQAYLPEVGDLAASSDEDEEFLGLPGLLTPEQTAALLARRDAQIRATAGTSTAGSDPAGSDPAVGNAAAAASAGNSWRDTSSVRRDITSLVARRAAETGSSYAEVHRELRKEHPGPGSAQATYDLLCARRDWLLSVTAPR